MKGVILAGGRGTRLRPLTDLLNKELIPVGKYPMIFYAIDKLRCAGIEDILLVISKRNSAMFTGFFGNGEHLGVRLSYRIQEDAGGVAQALSVAEPFIGKQENMVVLLGDNLFEDSLLEDVKEFERDGQGAKVFLKKVGDPSRYGVPHLHDGRISRIEEKPAHPQSHYCVTGIYMYDSSVFDLIRRIHPSQRGELEITDVNNLYAEQGLLRYRELAGWWIDAGTFGSLHEAYEKLKDYDSLQP